MPNGRSKKDLKPSATKKISDAKLQKLSIVAEKLGEAKPSREACQQCGLYKYAQSPFMYPHIPKGWSGKLLGVGEAPGEHEDERSHRPFTGKAGNLLRAIWRRVAYRDEDIALVNAIRCRPPGNKTPSALQIRCCRPFLLQTIRKLKPKAVVAFGNTALRALTNKANTNVSKERGKALKIVGLK